MITINDEPMKISHYQPNPKALFIKVLHIRYAFESY